MNTEKKYYKLKLCSFYEKHGKCQNGNKCNYAHGEKELREFKKDCIHGLNCFKKECLFLHPSGWNPEDNIRICEYYLNGYCINEENCKFKHIKEDRNKDEETKNDEFLDLKENTISNIINKDTLEDEDLSELIENNNVNLNYDSTPEIFVEDDKVEILINKLQKYTKKIKDNIDKTFIEDNYVYGINIKLELNKIMSEIELFKNNYQDIMCSFNKSEEKHNKTL